MESKTLQQCLDEVANKHGFGNWGSLKFAWAAFITQVEPHMFEAGELYASQFRVDQEKIREALWLTEEFVHGLPVKPKIVALLRFALSQENSLTTEQKSLADFNAASPEYRQYWKQWQQAADNTKIT